MDSAAQLRALEREVASLKSEMNTLDPSGSAVSRASVNAASRPKSGVSLPTTPPLNSSPKPLAAKLIEAEKPMVSLVAGDLIWLRSEGLPSRFFWINDKSR
jgi:hypothetical protein